jgi:hypothetical protein
MDDQIMCFEYGASQDMIGCSFLSVIALSLKWTFRQQQTTLFSKHHIKQRHDALYNKCLNIERVRYGKRVSTCEMKIKKTYCGNAVCFISVIIVLKMPPTSEQKSHQSSPRLQ